MPTTDLTQLSDDELQSQHGALSAEIARRAELVRLPNQYRDLIAQAEQVAQRYEHVGGDPANLNP